jgi:hypothetical protein
MIDGDTHETTFSGRREHARYTGTRGADDIGDLLLVEPIEVVHARNQNHGLHEFVGQWSLR